MNLIEMNEAFIVAAYSVTWLVLLGYVFRITRKGSQARADYARMASEQETPG